MLGRRWDANFIRGDLGRQARSGAEDAAYTAARQGEQTRLSSEAEAFKWPALIRRRVHVTSHLIR